MAKFAAADAILGATTIRQVTNASHRTGLEMRKAMTSGGVAVTQVSGLRSEEVTSVTSGDLAALVAIGTNTFCSAGLYVTGGTITIPYKSRSTGGTFASGSNHSALTGTDALIIPTSFEATQDGEAATCQFEVHWLSNGTTAGAGGSTGNSLASQSFNAEFALGPAFINATEIVGVQSIRVTPGITLVKTADKGLYRPTHISIQSIMPTIEITTNDIDAVVATVGAFTAMTSANVYFRKRVDSGIYSATTDNIRFTFAAGLTDTNSVEVSDNNNGTSTITLHGKTLTASAAVAIP
jgi:hypothetical protein